MFANWSKTFSFDTYQIQQGKSDILMGVKNTCEFKELLESGQPKLPIQEIRVSVPNNATNISISTVFHDAKTIKFEDPIEILPKEVNESIDSHKYIEKEIAYILNEGVIGGTNKVVTFIVSPVKLFQDYKTVTIYSGVTITLNWDISDKSLTLTSSSQSYNIDAINYTKSIVVNPEDVDKNGTSGTNKYNESIIQPFYLQSEYLIICPDRLKKPLLRLAALKNLKGYSTHIETIERILSLPSLQEGDIVSGLADDAGKLRAYLRDQYAHNGVKYVLIAGKYPDVPIRYGSSDQIPTDLYFGELNYNWNNSNGVIGNWKQDFDYDTELYIGRISFTTEEEINNYINKLSIYELAPGNGDASYLSKAFLTRQNVMREDYNDRTISSFFDLYGNSFVDFRNEDDRTITGSDIVTGMNANPCGTQFFIGHGNPGGVGVGHYKGTIYDTGLVALDKGDWFHFNEVGNGLDCLDLKDYPSWSFNISCTAMPFDVYIESNGTIFDVEKTFGDSYLLTKNSPGVVFMGNTRDSARSDGMIIQDLFYKQLKKAYETPDIYLRGVTASELYSKVRAIGNLSHWQKLMRNLLGDPAANLWINEPTKLDYKDAAMVFASETDGIIAERVHRHEYAIVGSTNDTLYKSVVNKRGVTSYSNAILSDKNKVTVEHNSIVSIYGKNTLPLILPTCIYDNYFLGEDHIIVDELTIGGSTNGGKDVTFSKNSDFTIESLSSVEINIATIFEPGAKLKIRAKHNVKLSNITIPSGASVHIDAESISTKNVCIEDGADVIFNGIPQSANNFKLKTRSSESTYTPMVEEGKTWWYTIEYNPLYKPDNDEFGLRIGAKTMIDNIEYHSINLIIPSYDLYGNQILKKERTIGYMREEDRKVYSLFDKQNWGLISGINTPSWLAKYDTKTSILAYDFENSVVEIGNEILKYKFYNSIDGEVLSYGNRFNKYSLKLIEVSDEWFSFSSINREGTYVLEGIGIMREGLITDGPFICPSYEFYDCGTTIRNVSLRYVTDSSDNILYENIGGLKLWEEINGIEDITTDSNNNIATFYTLQGQKVKDPTKKPGIYIKVSNFTTEKIIVR